jgi:hypothetical protein
VKIRGKDHILLTRATIWMAILAYTAGSIIFALPSRIAWRDAATRLAWTIACLALAAHFVCAFQFFHHWSHDSAYRETARQTEAVIGSNWGGGLFINYAVLALWVVDIVWWWRSGLPSYRAHLWPLRTIWHGFLIFIIFNATVVFKDGIVRLVGVVITAGLCLAWLAVAKQRQNRTALENN